MRKIVARWSDVPASLLTNCGDDVEIVVDGRGYVVFRKRIDPLEGIVEVVE